MSAARGWEACLASAMIALGACRSPESGPSEVVSIDSSGVRITSVPRASAAGASEWSTGTVPRVRIGAPVDGGPSQYFRISGVRMLSADRIMFSTDASKQLFVVDTQGTTIEVRGRSGRGPFEFQHLQMLKSTDTSMVALFDALLRQVTVVPTTQFEPTVMSLAALGLGSLIPIVRFTDGQLLVRRPGPLPAPVERGVVAGVDSLVRVDASGIIVAAFGGHPADERVLRLNASGGLTGGRPPYGRKLLVDGNDSVVVVVASGARELRLYEPHGGLASIVRVDRPLRPVVAATRRAYRERVLRDVRDDYGIREWTMLSNDDVFPAELPAFDLLLVDREGAIWVRETVTLADTVAEWSVFDRAGSPVGRARLPAGFTPYDITRDLIAGVWLDSLGGEQVQVWALTRR